jgi:hypothetical protein
MLESWNVRTDLRAGDAFPEIPTECLDDEQNAVECQAGLLAMPENLRSNVERKREEVSRNLAGNFGG